MSRIRPPAGEPCPNTAAARPRGRGGIDERVALEGGLTVICSVNSGRVSVKDLRELARQSGLVSPEQEELYQTDPFAQLQILTGRLPYAT